ncbi:MAG: rimM [Pseudonocardiales bacterium]|nr:rimM [Pseudonocardiales bacterium]
MSDEVLVTVGRIAKAHGLKGEVSVEAWTDDPDDRFQVGTVFTTEAAAAPVADSTAGPGAADSPLPATLTVASARVHSGRWLLSFEEVADRTMVETLRGTRLLLEARARRVLDDPDDFYDSDLTNLQARTPEGEVIGPVTDIVHGPAGDYIVIVIEGREHLVPFVAALVPTVDVAGGFLVVDAPEGLFDL